MSKDSSIFFDFFDVENDRVVINPNVLLVPEFKVIVDKYEDPIPALTWVRNMTYPFSPYRNVPEGDKAEIIARDIPGEYDMDDPELLLARARAEELYLTPTRRFYLDSKIGLERIGEYLRETTISSGRDGNDSTFLQMLKSVGSINTQFSALEKAYQEEVASLRGNQESSYDEND